MQNFGCWVLAGTFHTTPLPLMMHLVGIPPVWYMAAALMVNAQARLAKLPCPHPLHNPHLAQAITGAHIVCIT
jgi:hypothetical protein